MNRWKFILVFFFGFIQFSLAQQGAFNVARLASTKSTGFVDANDFKIEKFVHGSVVLPTNNVLRGVLTFNGHVVSFKDTAQKITRYSADEIKQFATPADTFYVYTDTVQVSPQQNSKQSTGFGPASFVKRRFIKEVLFNDKVCLYKSTVINSFGPASGSYFTPRMALAEVATNTFYVKRKNESQYTEIPKNKKDFKKMMAGYLKGGDDLIKAINNNELRYDDLFDIVYQYNNLR